MRFSLSEPKLAKRKRIQTTAEAEADRIGRPRVSSSSSSSCGDSRGVAMGSRQMHSNAAKAEPITQKMPANCPSGSAGHTLSLANKAAPIVKREKEM